MNPVKKYIVELLRKFGYEIRLISLRDPVPFLHLDVLGLIIDREWRRADDWFFIQIGAHDGVSFDPINTYIRDLGWRGILVEPQPKLFARLAQVHADNERLALENVAVGREDGFTTLYAFKDDGKLPYHATMLASFFREALEQNSHGYRGEIEEIRVPTLSVKTLLSKHNVRRVDLLQIDTEGFDKEIIRMFAEAKCWPSIIHFEDPVGLRKQNEAALRPLTEAGYSFYHLYPDTIAYRSHVDEGFRRRSAVRQRDLDALQPPPR